MDEVMKFLFLVMQNMTPDSHGKCASFLQFLRHISGTPLPKLLLGMRKVGRESQGVRYCCPTLLMNSEQLLKTIRDSVMDTNF